mmetsp:Transcript_9316/g.23113  ORF Transcript_9316/g.23113 Transcript_9316/m.23113 type:complete len:519 (+) Transcript_9316:335-1891(+)
MWSGTFVRASSFTQKKGTLSLAVPLGWRLAGPPFSSLGRVLLAEDLHELDEALDGAVRHRVVDADAEAADGVVARELLEAALLGLLAEEVLDVWPEGRADLDPEWNGDLGAVLIHNVVHVKARRVDLLVDLVRLPVGRLLRLGQAPVVGDLAQHKVQRPGGKDVRRVVQVRDRLGLGSGRVAEDAGANVELSSEERVVDDDDDVAGGAEVLAAARVDDAVLADVHGPGKERRSEVRHDGNFQGAAGWVLSELEAVDGLVGADVDVGPLGVDLPGAWVGVLELLVLVLVERLDELHLAVLLGLRGRTVGPEPAVDVGGLLLVSEQVQGRGAELAVGASLHQEDVVVVRHVQQVAEHVAHVRHAGLHGAAHISVAVLDEAHASRFVGEQFVLQVEQDLVADSGRAGAEVGDTLAVADHTLSGVLASEQRSSILLGLLLHLLELGAEWVLVGGWQVVDQGHLVEGSHDDCVLLLTSAAKVKVVGCSSQTSASRRRSVSAWKLRRATDACSSTSFRTAGCVG